jgi:hypothetical protein
MRLDSTYRAWPVPTVIFIAVVCVAAPELARDAIHRQLAAAESGIVRIARVIEDAFRLTPTEVKRETAKDVRSTSRPRRPAVRQAPKRETDRAVVLPLEAEGAPDRVSAATIDADRLVIEPATGPSIEAIMAVAQITDASAEHVRRRPADEAPVTDDSSADVPADADSDIPSIPNAQPGSAITSESPSSGLLQ